MKLSLVLLLVALAVFAYGEEKYTSKFDNIDLDELLKNDRLLQNYVKCLLDKGKCGADAVELKRVLPDALKTNCSKCSEKQKEGTKKIINHLMKNKQDWWKELQTKYDPQGTYSKKFESEIKKL